MGLYEIFTVVGICWNHLLDCWSITIQQLEHVGIIMIGYSTDYSIGWMTILYWCFITILSMAHAANPNRVCSHHKRGTGPPHGFMNGPWAVNEGFLGNSDTYLWLGRGMLWVNINPKNGWETSQQTLFWPFMDIYRMFTRGTEFWPIYTHAHMTGRTVVMTPRTSAAIHSYSRAKTCWLWLKTNNFLVGYEILFAHTIWPSFNYWFFLVNGLCRRFLFMCFINSPFLQNVCWYLLLSIRACINKA